MTEDDLQRKERVRWGKGGTGPRGSFSRSVAITRRSAHMGWTGAARTADKALNTAPAVCGANQTIGTGDTGVGQAVCFRVGRRP